MSRLAAVAQYSLAVLIGLYLGAGHHPGYVAATIAVAVGATIAARRSTRAVQVERSANRPEAVERDAVTRVVKDDLDRHVDGDLIGFTVDDVRHHAGTLV
jgi:ethanolamine ammonia-lyase large subunit